jgi:hypothetical protein
MDQPTEPRHPIGAEIDDSQNPTEASPADADSAGHEPGGEHGAGTSRQHEMLRQVQEMIDSLAREAKPVMRELAAKSAELAALAAERAGPLAAKAAEKTQSYGERFAARSKEMAAELRRQDAPSEPPAEATDSGAEWPEADSEAPPTA